MSVNALKTAGTKSTTFSTATSSTATFSTSSGSGAPTPGAALASGNDADKPAEDAEENNYLGTPGIIGISVGGGLGGLACIGAAIYICCFYRRPKKLSDKHEIQISDPLPNSGRHFATEPQIVESKYAPPRFLENTFPTEHSQYSPQRPSPTSSGPNGTRGSYDSELDREARRYEDMMPSAQPRLMI